MNWYARYPGDYMRDTAHLSLTEHGVYTVLLDHYYSTKEPLPKDYHALIRVCRAYEDCEKEAVKSIADKFFPVNGDGLRHNKRADIEITIAKVKSEKAAQSANVRWQNKGNANAYANASKTHMRSECSPQPQPQPHPEARSQKSEANKKQLALPCFDSDSFKSAWSDWQDHRREIKKPLTPKASESQMAEFKAWGESRSIAAIRHTIKMGWQGIREDNQQLKPTYPPQAQSSRRTTC